MKAFDVLTIGNAMIDAFLTIDEDTIFGTMNREEQMLCFRYGQKIHVNNCEFLLGGSACNVGVGLSRLGNKTALFAEIGSDSFSEKIMQFLAKEPIDSSYIVQTKGESASFAMGINYQKERTLFVSHVHRAHKFDFSNVSSAWVYLTSLGVEWKHVYKEVLAFLVKSNAKLAFSPGTHQMEEGVSAMKDVLEAASVLCMNKEEAARISGIEYKVLGIKEENEDRENVKKLLRTLQQMGPKIVSVTDGGNGSYSIDEHGTVRFLDRFPTIVVEKTGAGDAYASAFLTAVMESKGVDQAMRFGAINAASVIEHVGAEAGLLTTRKLEKKLDENKGFLPNVIS